MRPPVAALPVMALRELPSVLSLCIPQVARGRPAHKDSLFPTGILIVDNVVEPLYRFSQNPLGHLTGLVISRVGMRLKQGFVSVIPNVPASKMAHNGPWYTGWVFIREGNR